MDKNLSNTLFIISCSGLLLAGVIFLGISFFDHNETTTPLAAAIGCLLLSSLLTLVRQIQNKTD